MRNRKGSAGFTLVELMIVVAIVAIVAGVLFPLVFRSCTTGANESSGEDEALAWAHGLYDCPGNPAQVRASCVGRSTSGDGRVSCMVSLPGAAPFTVRCPSYLAGAASGDNRCKLPEGVLQTVPPIPRCGSAP